MISILNYKGMFDIGSYLTAGDNLFKVVSVDGEAVNAKYLGYFNNFKKTFIIEPNFPIYVYSKASFSEQYIGPLPKELLGKI